MEWESQYLYTKIEDGVAELKQGFDLKMVMVPLKFLYRWAYTGYSSWDMPQDSLYGRFYPDPVLNIKDSSFLGLILINQITQENSITVSCCQPERCQENESRIYFRMI